MQPEMNLADEYRELALQFYEKEYTDILALCKAAAMAGELYISIEEPPRAIVILLVKSGFNVEYPNQLVRSTTISWW